MPGELVPFGKHKGQPVEVLMADPGYTEWLLQQPWFRDRYQPLYQVIVNYAGEPQDTPEHNQLQASFLDDTRCLALARLLAHASLFDGTAANNVFAAERRNRHGYYTQRKSDAELYEQLKPRVAPKLTRPRVTDRAFEVEGWDVVFSVAPTGLWFELKSLPDCSCVCDHERDCPGGAICHGGDQGHSCRHDHGKRFAPTFGWWLNASASERSAARASFRVYDHCNEDCVWRDKQVADWLLDDMERLYSPAYRTVRAECKPDLGDDFPAVLRQVTRYNADGADYRCVLVRRHSFEHVTWEQVTEMFAASDIELVSEERLLAQEAADINNVGETPAGRSTT